MYPPSSSILSDKRKGNLFINLSGTLDRESVREIKDSIRHHYDGSGNIFFNVEKIVLQGEIPSYRDLLADVLVDCRLPPEKFYLIGTEGLTICPDGCRVIVRTKKKCCGKCRNCHC